MSKNQDKRRKERSGKSDDSRIENTDSLFPSSPPPIVSHIKWGWDAGKYVGKMIPNRFLRIIFYVTVVLIIWLVFFGFIFRDTSHFQYQPQSIQYGLESQKSPGINIGLTANVQNISSERRYLKNFIAVLWKDESSGETWFYSLPSWYGEVSLVQGSTTVPVNLPLSFEANEEKILIWQYNYNTTIKQDWNLLIEDECLDNSNVCANICANINKHNDSLLSVATLFNRIATRDVSRSSSTTIQSNRECTAHKYKFTILVMDSKGNIFDETGKLKSLDVMYDQWTFSNSRTFFSKLRAYFELSLEILYWKLSAIIPILK